MFTELVNYMLLTCNAGACRRWWVWCKWKLENFVVCISS